MTDEIANQLKRLEAGSREETWEAAKLLAARSADLLAELLRLLSRAERPGARAAAAYVLGFGRFGNARELLETALQDPPRWFVVTQPKRWPTSRPPSQSRS